MAVKFEDWKKLDIRIGKITNAKEHPNAGKLLVLEVDLGSERRTIVAGIKEHYAIDNLMGKEIVIIINLEAREIKGIKSEGMLLAAIDKNNKSVVLLQPEKEVEPGSKIE